MARLRVGCAGWSIPGRHGRLFAAGGSLLERYAQRFDCVEINSSFYRPHRVATYRRWADSVPAGFRFSVKLPRAISHELRLRGAGAALDRFLDEVAGLGRTLGGLLLQLPPSLAYDARTAPTFLAMLRRRSDLPVACEPRHPSWFTPDATRMLARHRVCRAAADPARVPEAAVPDASPQWTYWRWHGAPRIYYSAYDDHALRDLARQVAMARGRSAWVIFDNTAHGHAIADAARFQAIAAAARGGTSGHRNA